MNPADISPEATETDQYLPPADRRKLIAYLLLITLGWVGFHRLYIGKYVTGLMYMASLGCFGVGLVYDLLFLRRMVNQTNKERRERYAANPERHGRKKVEIDRPEWVGTKRFLEFLELPFQLIFWTFGPILLFWIYMFAGAQKGALVVLLIIGISVTVGSVNKLLASRPILNGVPLVSNVLHELAKIENYYFENRPGRSIFYLLYPITMWSSIWSKKTRAEMKVLIKPIALVGLALIVNIGLGYMDTYPPYLGIEDAIEHILLMILLLIPSSIVFLVPTIGLSMEMNLSGKIQKARFLACTPIIVIGLLVVMSYTSPVTENMFTSQQALSLQEERLSKDAYREDLTRITSMFASYEVNSAKEARSGGYEGTTKFTSYLDELLTSRVQTLVSGIAPTRESKHYEAWWIPGKEEGPWLIILMNASRTEEVENQKKGENLEGGDLLMVASNREFGTFSSIKGKDFPEHMLDCFTQDAVDYVFCQNLDIRTEQTLVGDRDEMPLVGPR